MKKILFLLLLSVASYGQADFPEGLNLGGNTATAETSKLVSQQPGTGTLNYVNATALPVSTATQDSLDMKLNISDLPTNLTLYPTTTASDVGGYVVMVTDIHDVRYDDPAVDVSTPTITSVAQLVSQRISDAGILIGQPGVFNVTAFGNIRRLSGTGTATFYFEVYHRDLAGTETLIGQSSNSEAVSSATYMEFTASLVWDDGDFAATDRIVIKTYANRIPGNSDPVYQFQFGGAQPVRILLPVPFSVVDAGYEIKTNKQNSLAVDGTAMKYTTVDAVNEGIVYKRTISQIRALSGTLSNNSFYTTDLEKEGNWYYDSTDITSIDNTGTILVTADGKRIKRIYETEVYVNWFNPIGNGIADDSTILQKAIDATPVGGTIIFNNNTKYAILTSLIIDKSLELEGNGASLVLTSGIYGIKLEKMITSGHAGNYFNTIINSNSFTIPIGMTIKEGDFLFLYSNTERMSGTKFGDYALVKKIDSGVAYIASPFLYSYQVDHILVYDGVDKSSIKNLTIDARNVPVLDSNTHVYGISFYGTNINIEKCTVLGNDYCGAGILANGINSTIKDCYVSGFLNTQGAGGTGRIGYGISVGGHNIVVDHCSTIDNKHNIMAGSGLVMSRKITYLNNYTTQDMSRFGELAVQGGTLFGHSVDCHANVLDLIVKNNWIEGQNIVMGIRNGTFKIKDNRIVMLGRTGIGDAIQVYESTFSNCDISSNTLIDSSGETIQGNAVHISCDAADKSIKNFKILDNNFNNYNILLMGTGTSAPSSVENLVVSGNNGSSINCAVTGNVSNSYFDKNNLSADTEGLLVSTSGNISGISISGNVIDYHKNVDSGAFSYGVRIEASSSLIPSILSSNVINKVNILADKASITSIGITNLNIVDNTVNYNWSLSNYGSTPIGNSNTAGTLTWKGSTFVSKEGEIFKPSIPTVGNWAVGDKIFNTSPANGINIGWVCVVAGTPGTWITFGKVDSNLLTLKTGTTAQRPVVTEVGYQFFDTTLNKTIWWDGSTWVVNGLYGSGNANSIPRFSSTYGLVNSTLTYDGVATTVTDGNFIVTGNANGTRTSTTFKNTTTSLAILGSEQSIYGTNTADFGLYVYGNNKLSFSTNNSRRLIIDGSGLLTISVAPTTSAGTYDILTRNTSTGSIEKIGNSLFPFLSANNIFTGNNTFNNVISTIGVTIDNGGSNTGVSVINNGSATGIRINSDSTGKSLVLNNDTGATGTPLTISKNNVDKFSVTDGGLVTMGVYTVATLPSPTGTAYATVTDALAPSYMVAVVGGGAVVTPVFYNGTNWIAH